MVLNSTSSGVVESSGASVVLADCWLVLVLGRRVVTGTPTAVLIGVDSRRLGLEVVVEAEGSEVVDADAVVVVVVGTGTVGSWQP